MSRLRASAAVAFALTAPVAFAHHSPAAYDMQKQVTIEGTVTAFEWANPHAYLSVKDDTARAWLIELLSPSALKQYGWSSTTLTAGDRVTVTAGPSRNPGRNIAFLLTLDKAGTPLLDVRGILRGAPPPPPPGAPAPRGAPAFSAKTLAGTWATLPGPAIGQLLGDAAALPVTPKGAAAMKDFTDTANPGRDCVPFPAPLYMIFPVTRSIEIGADNIVIRGEEGGVDRTVHMNRVSHDGAAASVQGDSIGHWENGALVVDTTRFAEHALGNAAGLPSSAAKHLVERFQLQPDGGKLAYTFTLEDPEYLTTPVSGMSPWVYRPDVAYAPIECNLDNARRFLGE